MGYGAYMNITNDRTAAVTTYVVSVQCVYQNGQNGSHLEQFNDRSIAAGATYPGGRGTYIEANCSGTCFFQSGDFTLKICDGANSAIIGNVSFHDMTANWELSDNTNTDVLNVDIDNSGDQAVITVTVAPS